MQTRIKQISYFDSEGNEITIDAPGCWEVCPRCNGAGKHVNPAVDEHGLTAEDFAEDPDFAENYYSGLYDVTCYECNGRTTVFSVDWEALKAQDPEAFEVIKCAERELGDMYAIEAMERRYGA